MRYLTVKKINYLDRLAIEKYGIPSIILMENAGRAVAEETIKLLRSLNRSITKSLIAVICGGGKNGGDGFVSARHLFNRGYAVKVYLLKHPASLSGDSLTNFMTLRKSGVPIEFITEKSLRALSARLNRATLIIDAIFGTGLKGKIEEIPARVISLINQTGKPIVAVDLPSGLDAQTGLPLTGRKIVVGFSSRHPNNFLLGQKCAKAKITVTMGYPKKGFLNPRAKKFIGKLVVADIGYPKQLKGR